MRIKWNYSDYEFYQTHKKKMLEHIKELIFFCFFRKKKTEKANCVITVYKMVILNLYVKYKAVSRMADLIVF